MRANPSAAPRAAGLVVGCVVSSVVTFAQTDDVRAQLLDPTTLTKFVDPLPNPLANPIAPSGTLDGSPLYEVSIGQFQQQLHRDLPATTLWGYNNSYPGPAFVVDSGQVIHVKWTNNLRDATTGAPLQHLLPYDTTVHGAHHEVPQARVVSHLHGGVTEARSDGYPEHWFGADLNAPANGMGGPAGNSFTTTYHNQQRAGNLWYHDHAMGITRLNVYAGMAGAYVIRDPLEQGLNLPSGQYEIPLVIQDRQFHVDGSLYYPDGHATHSTRSDGASVVQHHFGDTNLVNGKIWPTLDVEPRKYRFRVLNGANSRFYNFALDSGGAGTALFHQIGTDVGLLATRADRADLLVAPGDRADVIVDFSQFQPGQTITLRNLGPDGPFGLDAGPAANPATTGQVMQFKIVPPTAPDTSSLPTQLIPLTRYNESDAVVSRRLELIEETDNLGRPLMLLDGKRWDDPISEISNLGDLEIWEIENYTRDSHPIHLHLTHMQILDKTHRQTGPIPLEPWELGWEDTVVINPRETVRLFVKFEQFTGEYVWHCHMLEHEDHEMMRPLVVVPEPASGAAVMLVAGAALARNRRRVR